VSLRWCSRRGFPSDVIRLNHRTTYARILCNFNGKAASSSAACTVCTDHRTVIAFYAKRLHNSNNNDNTTTTQQQQQQTRSPTRPCKMMPSTPPSAAVPSQLLTPPSATSGGSGRPSLSPASDASSAEVVAVKRATGSHKILEAFGGKRKLWPLNGSWWPEFTPCQVAMKRVSAETPNGLSLPECLHFWGIEENDATRDLFAVAVRYESFFEGRIVPVSLAKKWIMNALAEGQGAPRTVSGEELDKTNSTGAFQGVALQYFAVEETSPGDFFLNQEQAFCNRIAQDIGDWLQAQPIPEGHSRLFHGTSTASMNDIVQMGIDTDNFERVGDFGPAFHCSDQMPTALKFAIFSAIIVSCEGSRRSASLMYFDVPNNDMNNLHKYDIQNEAEWGAFTKNCIGGKWKVAFADRNDVGLVTGKLVHNAGLVSCDDEVEPVAYEDGRMQYAFRKQTGDMLLVDKSKMGVALFDIYTPELDLEE
jgi:hypothetical protein